MLLFAVTAVRNLSVFVKIASFGVIFVSLIILFIFAVGLYSFTNTDFIYKSSDIQAGAVLIKMFNSNYAPLMGILGGGYYLHNITLPIIRNSKEPKNNVRDVFIGYFLVFLSYAICGVFGSFGF